MSPVETVDPKTRIRVAFVAHELSPYQGSECAGGWKLASQLATHGDIHLTVFSSAGPQHMDGKYRSDVEAWLKENGPFDNVEFRFISYDERGNELIRRNRGLLANNGGIGNPLLYFLAYRRWQRSAMEAVMRVHGDEPFDLVHVANLITLREPGPWLDSGIPLIWGPTGGVTSVSGAVRRALPMKARFWEVVRQLSWAMPTLRKRRVLNTISAARHVFFFDRREAAALGKPGRMSVLADSACGPVHSTEPVKKADGLLKVLIVGQLIERKGPRIALKALEEDSSLQKMVELTYLGTGPLETELRGRAANLVPGSVKFLGSVSHSEMTDTYAAADVLLHTSFREAGSHVVPEALTQGLPVICHAVGGLDFFVDDSCGAVIPLVDEQTSISAVTAKLKELAADRAKVESLSRGALVRASELGWSAMADRVADVYRRVAGDA